MNSTQWVTVRRPQHSQWSATPFFLWWRCAGSYNFHQVAAQSSAHLVVHCLNHLAQLTAEVYVDAEVQVSLERVERIVHIKCTKTIFWAKLSETLWKVLHYNNCSVFWNHGTWWRLTLLTIKFNCSVLHQPLWNFALKRLCIQFVTGSPIIHRFELLACTIFTSILVLNSRPLER